MSDEIKKIKIKELPQTTSINDEDIFVESDTVETYKVTADNIAKYISANEHLTQKYIPLDSKGVADGVVPLNSGKKIEGTYVTYGTTSNTSYEGSNGKILETNFDNHLTDENAHGYNSKINEEITRAKEAEQVNANEITSEVIRATTAENALDSKKADIASPTLTGIPKAPTASSGTNTTQIGTTAFTQTAVSNHNTSATAHTDIRDLVSDLAARLNALADSDDTTLDQLSEIVDYIKSNRTLIENVTTNKVNVADIVDNLISTAIDKPLSANQGKVLNDLINELTSAVSDHTHDDRYYTESEIDTKLNNKVDKVSGKGLSTNDYTTAEKNKLAGIDTGAEVNQNTFSNVIVGSTTISADSKTDSLTLAGSNITLTPDTTNDKITIEITKDDVIAALGYTPGTSSSDTTYGNATTSSAGLMSASDKLKLDSIASSADAVSFTQSLTSGTKVGTLTINGTDTDLYAPTNTDTHYTTGLKVGASATATANAAASNGNVYLNVLDNTTVRDSHKIVGSGATTVTSDSNGNITINSTNSTYNLGSFGITATAAEINKLDGLTATTSELNYVDGVTSNIQTQLNNKLNSTANAASATKLATARTIALTGSVTGSGTFDGSGNLSIATTTNHTHSYLPLSGGTMAGDIHMGTKVIYGGSSNQTSIQGNNATLNLKGVSYLNLLSPGIQCRNYNDSAWAGISAASFTNQSSRKYKKNIENMTEEVAKSLLDYRVVSYDYINELDGTNCLGLIAEEVSEICEYPVIRDADGNPDKIDYSRFVPQLIKMVQLQQEDINSLKETTAGQNDTIATLLERIARLESTITTE